MTNYISFPKWRDHGIVIKFSDYQYSWSNNTAIQRKYLLNSDYCNDAIEVYVWENDTIYISIDDFKDYLQNYKGYGTSPKCGKKLVLRYRKDKYDSCFLGCSGYPECHFIKKA